MSAYTLSQFRALLDPSCFPPSASNGTMNNLINKAREAVYNCMESGGGSLWQGTNVGLQLAIVTQSSGAYTITLPRQAETIEGIYGTNSGLLSVRNQWFSYLRVAPGNCTGGSQLDDQGDGFCGVYDPPSTGLSIKIQTTATETTGLTVIVYGTDTTGNPITETINIPSGTAPKYATSANTYATITEIVKSPTAGDLIVNLTDGTNLFFYARWQAGETTPNYRRYRMNFQTTDTALNALCKRRFIPLSQDNDQMDICNLLGMECALKAYRYLQASDLTTYRESIIEAVGYLNGELARYNAETEKNTLQFEPATSIGRVCNIP